MDRFRAVSEEILDKSYEEYEKEFSGGCETNQVPMSFTPVLRIGRQIARVGKDVWNLENLGFEVS